MVFSVVNLPEGEDGLDFPAPMLSQRFRDFVSVTLRIGRYSYDLHRCLCYSDTVGIARELLKLVPTSKPPRSGKRSSSVKVVNYARVRRWPQNAACEGNRRVDALCLWSDKTRLQNPNRTLTTELQWLWFPSRGLGGAGAANGKATAPRGA